MCKLRSSLEGCFSGAQDCSAEDSYAGYGGALKCMRDNGNSRVAFVKHTTADDEGLTEEEKALGLSQRPSKTPGWLRTTPAEMCTSALLLLDRDEQATVGPKAPQPTGNTT
eukprot:1154279-Pelagomonas_calceolata.AAC.3